MTDEEKKKAEETAKAEAEAKAKEKEQADADFEASLEGLSPEEQELKRAEREALNTDKTPDWKTIAQRERDARIKAQNALADKRFRNADRKRKDENGDDIEDDDGNDKPVTGRELQRILHENTQQTEKRLAGNRIREVAKDLADSPEEAEAIIEIHANRTFPSHLSIEEQVKEAHAIANLGRWNSTNSELKRALRSKGTASRDVAGTHRDSMESPAPKISSKDAESYKRAGFAFDVKDKLWKKKLPSGKFLIKDPKTKLTYLSK